MQGMLLLNKPEGITSFGAVARIKRLAHEKRVGHTGTLDPMATGVLPILLGKATALSSYLLDADKTYIASARLGIVTDTLDITGTVTEEKSFDTDNETLLKVLNSFLGKSKQIPPIYSALKKDGVRLYDIARKGGTAEIPPRDIEIFSLNLIKELDENGEFTFETTVSKGTYIRSLVRDIGEKLGTGATLTKLERTKTAGFCIDSSVNLNDLTEENITDYILSPDKAVAHFGDVFVTDKQKVRFTNGGFLDLDRIKTQKIQNGETVKVFSGDEFLGLGGIDTDNGVMTVKCVISEQKRGD